MCKKENCEHKTIVAIIRIFFFTCSYAFLTGDNQWILLPWKHHIKRNLDIIQPLLCTMTDVLLVEHNYDCKIIVTRM